VLDALSARQASGLGAYFLKGEVTPRTGNRSQYFAPSRCLSRGRQGHRHHCSGQVLRRIICRAWSRLDGRIHAFRVIAERLSTDELEPRPGPREIRARAICDPTERGTFRRAEFTTSVAADVQVATTT